MAGQQGGTITLSPGYGSIFGNAAYGNINLSGNTNISGILKLSNSMAIGGTVRAGCLLTVKGKISAQEFEVVTNTEAPDYVFDTKYQLLNLSELEKFIAQNKHLPNIPSAREQKDKGIELLQMNNNLLRKVEELTLYVIEINKKLEATQAELELLKGGK